MMKNFSILSFLIALSLSSFSQQKYTISGFINDKENGESLIGAARRKAFDLQSAMSEMLKKSSLVQ